MLNHIVHVLSYMPLYCFTYIVMCLYMKNNVACVMTDSLSLFSISFLSISPLTSLSR